MAIVLRLTVLLTLLSFLNLISGCTQSKPMLTGDQRALDESGVAQEKGIAIRAYVTWDGVEHEFDGYVRLQGDHFDFAEKESSIERGEPDFELSRSEVSWLVVEKKDLGRTVGTAVGVMLLTGVVVAIAASCPFIYSFDGKQYVFDGEPYGGAISRGLERTDWSELEHLAAVNGEYKILLSNELDETQHTNMLELWVVDHPAGTEVALESDGTAHAFSNFAKLDRAYLGNDVDLTSWLLQTDHVAWYSDLSAFAGQSLDDTRQTITLEFPRPQTEGSVYLLANASTGHWGSHMIRRMLEFYGDQVGQYYSALDEQEHFRKINQAWHEREELYQLSVYVQKGEQWERQGSVPGGGPYVSETRAIPLDLSGLEADRVRVRLKPPIGFWSLNSFRLGWGEERTVLEKVKPRSAVNSKGQSVMEQLRDEDGRYLVMSDREGQVELVFSEPAPRYGMKRTVYASTRGWYRVHLYENASMDEIALRRLQSEPGAIVRLAVKEYVEFQKSGILRGVDRNVLQLNAH